MNRFLACAIIAAVAVAGALGPEYAKANVIQDTTASVAAGASSFTCCKDSGLYDVSNKYKSLSYPSTKAKSLPLSVTAAIDIASGAAKVSGGTDPTISTAASMVPSDAYGGWGGSGGGFASLTYFVEIVGPGSGYVPVDISAQYSALCPYNSIGLQDCSTASLDVGRLGGTQNSEPVGFNINPNGTATLPFGTGTYSTKAGLEIGAQVSVEMMASSGVYCDGDYVNCSDGSAFSTAAMVDPIFTIDPNFANADQYQVLMSPDLTIPAPAPEPASLLLFGTALAGLDLVRRRRLSA